MDIHAKKVVLLQEQVKARGSSPLSLHYASGQSNTVRTKDYKKAGVRLNFADLNQVIRVDPEKRVAVVEPRVTMEQLAQATLKHGLMPPVVPEFKGITVGGAIMGAGAESGSHRWGVFSDACRELEILCGDGSVARASDVENRDLFYGVQGSYGSIGALLSAELSLVPAKKFVRLRYHFFSDCAKAVEFLRKLCGGPDFLDGIVFAKDACVIIEGTMEDEARAPLFSMRPLTAEWYYQHVRKLAKGNGYEETMRMEEYLFRYDQGAFWVGSYLFRPALLMRFIAQGLFRMGAAPRAFSEKEVRRLHEAPEPNAFFRALLKPFFTSQRLWKLQHMAGKWVQDRSVIQDFCIPEGDAARFLREAMDDPGIFPLWLCPIKGTRTGQIFAPHLLSGDGERFINVGLYGLPCYYAPIGEITRKLEMKTRELKGRKVLYSQSYYTPQEFWEIYPRAAYEALREKARAHGVWHEITDKVLSE